MSLPGAPKDVHVNVILNSEKKGDFEIQPDPPNSLPRGTNGELEFENKGHSGFWIYFHLKDPNKLGYTFTTDKKHIHEALWSMMGSGACPEEPVWDVLTPRKVLDEGMTLKVRNPNVAPDVGKFGYTLRVTKDGGARYLDLDPGGNNKNGPIAPFVSAAVASTMTGAIVGLAAVMLLDSAAVRPNALLFAIGGALVGLVLGLVIGRR